MTSVTIDDVRDTINISSADISDSKILKMLKRAEVVEKSVQGVIKTKVFLIMGNLAIQLTGDYEVGLNVKENRRTVVEVRDDLHREIRKLALLNDLRIYELTNAIIEDFLRDQERETALIKRLKIM